MASIEKRGKNSYRVKIRMRGYPVQIATFQTRTDAKRWASDTEADIRHGRHFKTQESKRHTFGEMIDRYMREILPSKKSARSQRQQLTWWKTEIGSYTLANVTPQLIAQYRDKLLQEPIPSRSKNKNMANQHPRYRTHATCARYLASISHAYSVAIKEWGWAETNPLSRITKPKESRGRVRFLSDDERSRLLKACKESNNQFLYAVVVVALSTGMRLGEIMNLTWDVVDLNIGRAILHETKNGERRAVAIAGLALEVLKDLSKVRRIDSNFLFPAKGSKPKRPIDLRRPWELALKTADIPDFRFHDLRHSAASYLVMNGASLAEIAEILGHRSLSMVRRYAHISEHHTARVVANMNAKIFGENND